MKHTASRTNQLGPKSDPIFLSPTGNDGHYTNQQGYRSMQNPPDQLQWWRVDLGRLYQIRQFVVVLERCCGKQNTNYIFWQNVWRHCIAMTTASDMSSASGFCHCLPFFLAKGRFDIERAHSFYAVILALNRSPKSSNAQIKMVMTFS